MVKLNDVETAILTESIRLGSEAAIHLLRKGRDPRIAFRALLATVDLDVEAEMDHVYGKADDARTRETKP